MALRVWLPLNGSLENKGISDYEIRSANITIADDGKIGKCYSFNGSNSYINITNFEIGNNWSYGCWVNTPNSDSRNWEIVMILNNSGSDADSQFAFWIHQKENRFESLANTQYVSTIPYTNYYNGWHHFFATFNGTLLTTYIDGNIVNTKTITATQYNAMNLTIGARSTNAAGTAFTSWFQGKLNDIRVYDNCLSSLEVKEISQGLILHYKLDGFSGGAGENLIPNTTTDIRTYDYPTSGFKDYFAVTTVKIPEGEKYTLSFYAKSTVAGDKIRAHYYSPNTTTTCISNQGITKTASDGNMDFTLSTDWELYWVTYTQTATTAVKRIILPRMGAVGNTNGVVSGTGVISIKNVKLEKGEIATSWCPTLNEMGINITKIVDSSGYGNDGSIVGTLLSEASDRYQTGLYSSSGVDNRIVTPSLNFNTDAVTLNIWFKSNNTSPTGNYHMVVDSNANRQWYEICVNNNGYLRGGLFVNGTRYADNGTSTSILNGNWHMLTMTYDGNIIKRYVDGIMEKSTTIAKTTGLSSPTAITLFRDGPSATYACKETTLSDFRIYTTALSTEDIMTLYHTPAQIDNLQNAHMFEAIEDNNVKVEKNGIFRNQWSEGLELKTLSDGSIWAKLYYFDYDVAGSIWTPEQAKWCNSKGKYSCLGDLEKFIPKSGWYEFWYTEKADGSQFIRWKQSYNPLSRVSSSAGGTASEYTFIDGTARSNFTGLTRFSSNDSSNCYLRGVASWWGAIAPYQTSYDVFPTMWGSSQTGNHHQELWINITENENISRLMANTQSLYIIEK